MAKKIVSIIIFLSFLLTNITFAFNGTGSNEIGLLILGIYGLSLILGSFLAVLMIIIGGIQWSISTSNPQIKASAKDRITKAVLGLLVLLFSVLILNIINPDLTKIYIFNIKDPPDFEEGVMPYFGNKAYQPIEINGWQVKNTPPLEEICDVNSDGGNIGEICQEECNDICQGEGFHFGTTGGYTAGTGRDKVWCTCYKAPEGEKIIPFIDKGETSNFFSMQNKCFCGEGGNVTKTPTCGELCFNQCKNNQSKLPYIFGVMKSCSGKNSGANFACSCYAPYNYKQIIGPPSSSNSFNFNSSKTFGAKDACECFDYNGENDPKNLCGAYCLKTCHDRGYKWGYVERCKADSAQNPGEKVLSAGVKVTKFTVLVAGFLKGHPYLGTAAAILIPSNVNFGGETTTSDDVFCNCLK